MFGAIGVSTESCFSMSKQADLEVVFSSLSSVSLPTSVLSLLHTTSYRHMIRSLSAGEWQRQTIATAAVAAAAVE